MRFIILLALLISINGFGQYKDYKIGPKGDTLNRIDMQGKKQGPWVVIVPELRGEQGYEEEGYFENDKRVGTWRRYTPMGDKIAQENYRWGNKDGICQYFLLGGGLVREESWKAVNPDNPWDTVPVTDPDNPDKVLRYAIVKLEGFSLKHGTWTYYDPQFGTITKHEKYFLDKIEGAQNSKGEDLTPIDVTKGYKPTTDSLGNKSVKKTAEMMEYEKKNSGKKSVKVRDGKTGY
ncbi:MAG: hypothetical protein E6H07_17800 [Bacteroidetes bacterium]|nr:MAG: hypothetical protein E6H07_17800 [Bacteroidota bacterium]